MTLKDLVSNEKDSTEKKKKEKARNNKLSLYSDLEKLEPSDCTTCGDGTRYPVKGISDYGSLFRCHNIFCERSIWSEDVVKKDPDALELQGEMTKRANPWS